MSKTMIANRYAIESELGAGGMGVVYRATDHVSQAVVAIKQIKPQVATPEFLARFKREGDVLRELDHPNIIKLIEIINEGDNHYLVMRYIAGGNLSQRILSQRMTVDEVVHVGIELADALTQAHKLNIIHRDLKPANVLLDEDRAVYLTDFGLAQVMGQERLTQTDAIIGTVDYLPPETFAGIPHDARSDIWSLGVLLTEMLLGRNPFARTSIMESMWAITSEDLPDLESALPDVPVALLDVIYRMLERDPEARITSMRHVGAALEDIRAGHGGQPATTRFRPPSSATDRRAKHNLPVQTTPFVGRDREADDVLTLLQSPQHRLVTIIGQGGMGKTRLALEIGQQALDTFEHGVWFVQLAPLTTPESIVPAIADAIGFQFQQDDRDHQQQLLDFLSNKEMLLILDNHEHLIDKRLLVTDILRTAPDVVLLVTSRQRLNQSGETLYELPHMEFPDQPDLTTIERFPAMMLFLQCARRLQPNFEIEADTIDAVIRICRTVHGLPLGIVLAASWLSMLSPDEIADELDQSTELLEAELDDLPERQRSMRAVFEYSWQLLSADEQTAFTRLAVFRGGFSREAAQTVAGSRLLLLRSLVNKSLLRRDVESGQYHIHELLRQYGEEKLRGSQVEADTRRAHREYYLSQLADLRQALRTDGQLTAVATIETTFENIRSAWHNAIEAGARSLLAAAAESLYHYAHIRNRQPDIAPLFDAAIRPASDNDDVGLLLWAALTEISVAVTIDIGRIDHRLKMASASLDEAALTPDLKWLLRYVQIQRQLIDSYTPELMSEAETLLTLAADDPFQQAVAYHTQGYISRGNRASVQYTENAYNLFKQSGNLSWTARQANNMAVWMMSSGQLDRAEAYLDECLSIYRMLGDQEHLSHALCIRGNMYFISNNLERAAQDFGQALPVARDIGNVYAQAMAYNGKAMLALLDGKPDAVVEAVQGTLTAAQRVSIVQYRQQVQVIANALWILSGYAPQSATILGELATFVRGLPPQPYHRFFTIGCIYVIAEQGDTAHAVEIAGALQSRGLPPGMQVLIAPLLARLRATLGDEATETALAAGAEADFGTMFDELIMRFAPDASAT